MVEAQKTIWKSFLQYIWMPFTTIMTATSLIQIGDTFWPTLIEWGNFFEYWFECYREFKDWLYAWVPIKISNWWKNYFIIGLFIAGSIFTAVIATDQPSIENNRVLSLNLLMSFLAFSIGLLAWPISLIFDQIVWQLASIYMNKEEIDNNAPGYKVFRLARVIMLRAILLLALMIFTNYLIIQISGDYPEHFQES